MLEAQRTKVRTKNVTQRGEVPTGLWGGAGERRSFGSPGSWRAYEACCGAFRRMEEKDWNSEWLTMLKDVHDTVL